MAGDLSASMERYAARKADGATKRLEHLGAMTPLELLDEILSMDSEITSTLRAIHKHKVNRSYIGDVVDCDRQLWHQLDDQATKRMAQLDAMTYLELIDEILSMDSEITSTLRAIHKHKVNRSYIGDVVDCDRQLWHQLDGRFLTLNYKVDPT